MCEGEEEKEEEGGREREGGVTHVFALHICSLLCSERWKRRRERNRETATKAIETV